MKHSQDEYFHIPSDDEEPQSESRRQLLWKAGFALTGASVIMLVSTSALGIFEATPLTMIARNDVASLAASADEDRNPAQVFAKELLASHVGVAHVLADSADDLFGRELKASSLGRTGLDDTTLGMPGTLTGSSRTNLRPSVAFPSYHAPHLGYQSQIRRDATRGPNVKADTVDMKADTADIGNDPEDIDSIEFVDTSSGVANKGGAGQLLTSPDWLTQMQRLWGKEGDLPVANAQVADIEQLLGGGLFQPLFKWMMENGPVYLLPTGPASSYAVLSDPAAIKHVLRGYGTRNNKGMIAEVGGGENGPFGDGFALLEGDAWRLRRKAVQPGIHKEYIKRMVETVMVPSAQILVGKLEAAAKSGTKVNIEDYYSQVTLDIIGKATFNYDFQSLTKESPIVQAVYTALKEAETRSQDLVPIYKLPGPVARAISGRQRTAYEAISLIRTTVGELVTRGKEMVKDEMDGKDDLNKPNYINDKDPSLLRFLLASREEVSSKQLRDDLVSILIAGHETTAAVLTWLTYMLLTNRESLAQCQAEVREVLGDRLVPTYQDIPNLRYIRRCIDETMRLYPQPPVYTRRALVEEKVPTSDGRIWTIPAGQDILLSIYNMHRNPAVWGDDAGEFKPMRFGPLDKPPPTEASTDYKFIPFSAGPRKCPGDQFALMEATTVVASMLRRFDFELAAGQTIGMTSGATIHTSEGLYVNVRDITKGA
eukprot:gnl/TRDRNA2_/TRDRNA2_164938_c1_seq1.p1 gnl/TRDRNA2_/TRDRNA2_164938_c1~~gnl/TRDRNA2_/TRDRNA2_164938_c1_seq1.p1  ORF type:complete len:711 (+),score=126.19 gnl/TRDRNA2_/TRDRNA2_164938_c1_seq1:37-2169(+)